MSDDWKPGTVAVICWSTDSGRERAIFNGDSWMTEGGVDVHASNVTDVRPLVVLDPDEIATPEENAGIPAGPEIAKCLRRLAETDAWSTWRARVAVRIADQIEAQTRPPRIPEPGLWGVVEAHVIGTSGNPQAAYHWVHVAEDQWEAIASQQPPRRWAELLDPALIHEGVA